MTKHGAKLVRQIIGGNNLWEEHRDGLVVLLAAVKISRVLKHCVSVGFGNRRQGWAFNVRRVTSAALTDRRTDGLDGWID